MSDVKTVELVSITVEVKHAGRVLSVVKGKKCAHADPHEIMNDGHIILCKECNQAADRGAALRDEEGQLVSRQPRQTPVGGKNYDAAVEGIVGAKKNPFATGGR